MTDDYAERPVLTDSDKKALANAFTDGTILYSGSNYICSNGFA